MRSLALPDGFALSSLTSTRALPSGTTRRSSTSGVFPMDASRSWARAMAKVTIVSKSCLLEPAGEGVGVDRGLAAIDEEGARGDV